MTADAEPRTDGSLTRPTPTTDPEDAVTAAIQAGPVRRRGSRLPARARIMAWLLLVMTAGLASVVILVAQFEYRAILDRVNSGLAQDAQEFQNFAAAGIDPTSDRVITSATGLFERYLTVQSTDRAEILLGISDTGEGLQVLPVAHDSVRSVPLPEPVIRTIVTTPENTGQVMTDAGELRWIRTAVTEPLAQSAAAWFVGGYFIDEARTDADRTVRTLAVVCAIALVVGAGVSWIVAGQILAPVRTVRMAAADLTEHDLTTRIPVEGRDDIAALAEQYNAMLDRLEAAFGTRRQFLDDAGHELRTPITIVRGHLELMGEDPVERDQTVRLCIDELDRMGRIVDDMLLLAKAEQPDFIQVHTVSVPDLTTDIDAKLRAIADRHWSLESIGEGEADLDSQRVTQAILQLAQNAVQHTRPGDSITTGSAIDGTSVVFWVSDTGPGVPEQEVERIFERFARGASATSDRRGAGLGLAIVKAIADGHHGRAWVMSEPGRGATFGLELPLAERHRSTEEVAS